MQHPPSSPLDPGASSLPPAALPPSTETEAEAELRIKDEARRQRTIAFLSRASNEGVARETRTVENESAKETCLFRCTLSLAGAL